MLVSQPPTKPSAGKRSWPKVLSDTQPFFVGKYLFKWNLPNNSLNLLPYILLHSYSFPVSSHLWRLGSEPKDTSWISSNHSHLRAGWPHGLFWYEQFSFVCIGPSQGRLCKDTVWDQGAPCPCRLVVNTWALQREQDEASLLTVLLFLIEIKGFAYFQWGGWMATPVVSPPKQQSGLLFGTRLEFSTQEEIS